MKKPTISATAIAATVGFQLLLAAGAPSERRRREEPATASYPRTYVWVAASRS
jgi:hypothetical protein